MEEVNEQPAAQNNNDEENVSHDGSSDSDDESSTSSYAESRTENTVHCHTYDDHKIKHIRRRLENNDPRLVKLSIGIGSYEPSDGDWERDGRSVGANTNIKTLVISGDTEDYATGESKDREEIHNNIKTFLRGVANNRSIEELELFEGELEGETFDILTPFFKNNQNLRRIYICLWAAGFEWDEDTKEFQMFLRCLTKFNTLKELELESEAEARVSDGALSMLIPVLRKHQLEKLSLSYNGIGWNGCRELASWLSSPDCTLKNLYFVNNFYAGTALPSMVVESLVNNTSLENINFYRNMNVPSQAWRRFAAVLQNPKSMLEKLDLSYCIIEDDVAIGIVNALYSNRRLKHLGIGSSTNMTINGFRAFATLLQRPDCVLEVLNLSHNQVNDEIVTTLTYALANNHTLKTMCISTAQSNEHWTAARAITSVGWDALLKLVCNVSSIKDTYQSNHTLYVSTGHGPVGLEHGQQTKGGCTEEDNQSSLQ